MPRKKKERVCLLSEYKIDETDKNMLLIINQFNELVNKKEYYYALYTLDDLILQDGTSSKFNDLYLNLILDHYDDIMKKIKVITSNILLDEKEQNKYEKAIANADIYNFFYFRKSFEKFEVSLSEKQLKTIKKKKLIHNSKVIKRYPALQKEYNGLINDMKSKKITADSIYEKIESLNQRILDENGGKLFYIYDYLDIDLIENNDIFTFLEKDKFYLNQFSFGLLNNLGISIGYSNNIIIKYRYIFLLLKNKINKLEEKNKGKDTSIEFVFKTFKNIFANIKENKYEYVKYFILLFLYVMFEKDINVANIYKDETLLSMSYFKILCEQFSLGNNIDKDIMSLFKKGEDKKIELSDNHSEIRYMDKNIILNNKNYSSNSFIISLLKDVYNVNEIILKNSSRKLFCEDKIYEEYHDDFMELLQKICCSNVAKIMQSKHDEFKDFKMFYSDNAIKKDLFNNRLKFYPFKVEGLYGLTDKYLLEIYMSSIYLNNINPSITLDPDFREILYIFNMGFHSVTFQHEALNHYVRAYLFYFSDESNRKISIDTRIGLSYYPKQNLKKVKEPLYLKKFLTILKEEQLNELSKTSNLKYNEYYESDDKEPKETKCVKKEEGQYDDEGYYYERQLFTEESEKKLVQFNFLQAIMLIDEDAYNLDPVHFHYCFLELKNISKYRLIKDNFRSKLLCRLLKDLKCNINEKIEKLNFIAKRSSDEENIFIFNFPRSEVNDVMSSYATKK